MSLGILIIRLVIGLTIAAHGAQKLFGWFGGYGPEGTGKWLEGFGFRPGRMYAIIAGIGELVGGLLLAIGFLTPIGAALITAVMTVAIATVHMKAGYFVTDGGPELPVINIITAVGVAIMGARFFSLDHAADIIWRGGSAGLFALLVGIAGGLLTVALRRVEVPRTTAGDRVEA